MLSCRDSITSICTFHCQCCKLSCAMNLNSIVRRKFKDVLKMLIRNNKNMSFIVRPPFACYKCRYLVILKDDIPLLCSLIRSLDTPNTTKWTFIWVPRAGAIKHPTSNKTEKQLTLSAAAFFYLSLTIPITKHTSHLYGADINNKAIFHVGSQYTFVSFVNLISGDDLNVRRNIMFCTEIEHLLRFTNATNHGTCE